MKRMCPACGRIMNPYSAFMGKVRSLRVYHICRWCENDGRRKRLEALEEQASQRRRTRALPARRIVL